MILMRGFVVLISISIVLCEENHLIHEDGSHFTEQFAIQFVDGVTFDEAQQLLESHDFKITSYTAALNVFRATHDAVTPGSTAMTQDVDQINDLRENPAVESISQLEHRIREKRGYPPVFAKNDDDAVIKHGRQYKASRDYPSRRSADSYFRPDVSHVHAKVDELCNGIRFNDPLYKDQWYYCNIGQTGGQVGFDNNVTPVWRKNITGKGVVVSILDDGVQYEHDDLINNFDEQASLDMNNPEKGHDPSPRGDEYNSHGTKCAGEIAAEANNNKCGVGIAYEASIGGVRILDGSTTDLMEAEAVLFNCDHIDIFSASWGPTDDGKTMAGPGKYLLRAIQKGVNTCRNGKGALYVWATGNGGSKGDDCGADGYVGNPNVISIGSINQQGEKPDYMEQCASTIGVVFTGGASTAYQQYRELSRPSINVVTTGINNECVEDFVGTSAAAPLAAGIFALLLQANPELTHRDVMHLVVRTSAIPDIVPDWVINGAGFHFNRRFGFGKLDAGALVEMGQNWDLVPEMKMCEVPLQQVDVTIPPNSQKEMLLKTVACEGDTNEINSLEHLQIHVHITTPARGNINITLVSPSGTPSLMLGNRPNDDKMSGIQFTFTSVHFWGEDPTGTWKIIIGNQDQNKFDSAEPAKLTEIGLVLYGTTEKLSTPTDGDTEAVAPTAHDLEDIAAVEAKDSKNVNIKSADEVTTNDDDESKELRSGEMKAKVFETMPVDVMRDMAQDQRIYGNGRRNGRRDRFKWRRSLYREYN